MLYTIIIVSGYEGCSTFLEPTGAPVTGGTPILWISNFSSCTLYISCMTETSPKSPHPSLTTLYPSQIVRLSPHKFSSSASNWYSSGLQDCQRSIGRLRAFTIKSFPYISCLLLHCLHEELTH